MIQIHLWSVQIRWMMFMRIFMITIQVGKGKILIAFDDMIADIMTNKIFQATIKELYIRCRKLNISLVFIPPSYFSVPKDVRLNSTHYLSMKINNKENYKILQLIILHTLITKIL